ncbi:hypothetical protein N7522_012399 [Penicillium canescens]|nr:hypothetical protein N7522_012399 [Penicillium canescens]
MYNTHTDIWVAGAFAAVVVDFVVYPFDTLKTRIQSPNYEKVFKDARTGAVQRNVLFKGLYQGVWSVVFSTIPSSEVLKQNAQIINQSQSKNNKSTLSNEGKDKGKGNKSAMRQVISKFRHHPWRLWSGYTALVSRNLPTTALQFPMFEYVRSRLIERRRRRKAESARRAGTRHGTSESGQSDQLIERAGLTGLAAAISGSIASTVTTPIDVVKTRVMLSASEVRDKGPFAVGRDILRNEGVRGLFKGGLIRAGWTAIALGLYLGLYEGGRFWLEKRRMERDGVGRDEGEAVV